MNGGYFHSFKKRHWTRQELSCLEESIDNLNHRIATWKPPTPWEAANHRELKWLKQRRTELERYAVRRENEMKNIEVRERRQEGPRSNLGASLSRGFNIEDCPSKF